MSRVTQATISAKRKNFGVVTDDPNTVKLNVSFSFTKDDIAEYGSCGVFGEYMLSIMVSEAKSRAPGSMKDHIFAYTTTFTEAEFKGLLVNNHPWASAVHNGTGLYGPTHSRITPKHSKALHWINKDGKDVYATSVKGQRPNQFLSRAIDVVKRDESKYKLSFSKVVKRQSKMQNMRREKEFEKSKQGIAKMVGNTPMEILSDAISSLGPVNAVARLLTFGAIKRGKGSNLFKKRNKR